ncbi:MAG: hypothetical protein MZV64_34625 [Ignavibacteriales bacterium]|nr:hypothetical protein [Ignavibacteriales bacterium]
MTVTVHADDHPAPRIIEPRAQRRRLTEIAPETDHPHPGVAFRDAVEHRAGAVNAAVVDQQQFPGFSRSPRERRPSADRRYRCSLSRYKREPPRKASACWIEDSLF